MIDLNCRGQDPGARDQGNETGQVIAVMVPVLMAAMVLLERMLG